MAKRAAKNESKPDETETNVQRPTSQSAVIATKGVKSSVDFIALMSGLMADVLNGTIQPAVCNAAVSAGAQMLKMVQMQQDLGTKPLQLGGRQS